jgi:hypothetical protein
MHNADEKLRSLPFKFLVKLAVGGRNEVLCLGISILLPVVSHVEGIGG